MMMIDDEEKKDGEDAELGDDAIDDVLGAEGALEDEEDDPLMAGDHEPDEEGRDWA